MRNQQPPQNSPTNIQSQTDQVLFASAPIPREHHQPLLAWRRGRRWRLEGCWGRSQDSLSPVEQAWRSQHSALIIQSSSSPLSCLYPTSTLRLEDGKVGLLERPKESLEVGGKIQSKLRLSLAFIVFKWYECLSSWLVTFSLKSTWCYFCFKSSVISQLLDWKTKTFRWRDSSSWKILVSVSIWKTNKTQGKKQKSKVRKHNYVS